MQGAAWALLTCAGWAAGPSEHPIYHGLRQRDWFVGLCSLAHGTGDGSGSFQGPKLQCSRRSPAWPRRQQRDKAELCLLWRCFATSGRLQLRKSAM